MIPNSEIDLPDTDDPLSGNKKRNTICLSHKDNFEVDLGAFSYLNVTISFVTEKHKKTFNGFEISYIREAEARDTFQ